MKILWIEDFGAELEAQNIIIEIFHDLIPLKLDELRKAFDPDEEDVARQFMDLLKQDTLHEIYICKSYIEWRDTFEQHNGDFDVVLVDINLTSHPTPDDQKPVGVNHPEFDKKAGFHIYHQLIKRGISDEDIAFFTGEGQTLGDFSRYCGDILLDRPKNCFEKNPLHFERLRQWLTKKAQQETLILRRGIIDGCRFMKNVITAIDDRELEPQLLFYKTTSRDISKDPEAIRNEFIEYLTRLEAFFLRHGDNIPQGLYLFVKDLAAKWDISSGYFRRSKAIPHFKTKLEDLFFRTGQFLMKRVRNWSSHGLLSEDLSEKDVAYFFMLAMRSWIKFDLDRILRHEEILSPLFTPLPEAELNRQINSVLANYLEQSYYALRSLYSDVLSNGAGSADNATNVTSDNHFLSVLKELGEAIERIDGNNSHLFRRRVRDVSLRLLYQGYWHGLFPLWINSTLYGNLQSLGFNLEPVPPGSFLDLLARAVLKASFEEEPVMVEMV